LTLPGGAPPEYGASATFEPSAAPDRARPPPRLRDARIGAESLPERRVDQTVDGTLPEDGAAIDDGSGHGRRFDSVEPAPVGEIDPSVVHDGAAEPAAGPPGQRHVGNGRHRQKPVHGGGALV
jgi:hypothetical protein